ncbi:hypothetical protein ACGFZP_02480 [Kitasatospora sp. NPDC048239]|uniref:hypothetical protein n=1 Tax=Kitasatospora sp. NPDC048239 TaxID=3364046 RepID=UPI0037173F9C
MTVPNTPPDPARAAAGTDADAVVERRPDAAPNPYGPPPALDLAPLGRPTGRERLQRLLPELRLGVLITLVCVLLGLVVAALWVWLAPKVPLVVDGNRILYGDPEGEQRAGADSVFALIGLGAGIVTALGAFLLSRRRGGGIAVAVGLALGGLLGSVAAWRLGIWMGPGDDLIAQASKAGNGGHFDAALELGAHGALLVWPMVAMVALLAFSAAFGKREEDPPPYWAGPYAAPAPGQDGQPLQAAPPQAAPPQDHRPDRPTA